MSMRVEPVGIQQRPIRGAASHHRPDIVRPREDRPAPDVKKTRPRPPLHTNVAPKPASIDTDRQEGPRAKGVLRLLDEGHFRGVADVRLRINFFDELSAGATRQAQAAVGDASNELLGEINRSVDELLAAVGTDDENAALIGEAIQTFEASLAEAVSAFQSSDAPSRETLATEIQTAFDTLLATLTATLVPSDQTPETPPPTDAEEAPNAVVASPADDGVGAGTDDAASSPKSADGAGSLRASTTDRVSLVASADSTIDQRDVAAIDPEPDGLSDPAATPSSDARARPDAQRGGVGHDECAGVRTHREAERDDDSDRNEPAGEVSH